MAFLSLNNLSDYLYPYLYLCKVLLSDSLSYFFLTYLRFLDALRFMDKFV